MWTDKKHLAKKAAAAARRSASATGGGPSTAPSLSQWELKIVSIMGDGFGEPQTSARSQAFIEHVCIVFFLLYHLLKVINFSVQTCPCG